MKKRILALLLIVCLVVAIPFQVSAASVSSKAPTVSVSTNSSGKPVVKWSSIKGAGMYQVKCRVDGGKWKEITCTQGTTYTHSKATAGSKYEYAVKPTNGSVYGYSSAYYYYYATPKVSVTKNKNSLVIKWNSISGANMYELRYRANGGSWNHITYLPGTSYTHSVKPGKNYEYLVKVHNGVGSKAGTAIYKYKFGNPHPVEAKVDKFAPSITIKWGSVSGATKYEVWYQADGGAWQKLGVYKGTSTKFALMNGIFNTKIRFRVKVCDGIGSEFADSNTIKYNFFYLQSFAIPIG